MELARFLAQLKVQVGAESTKRSNVVKTNVTRTNVTRTNVTRVNVTRTNVTRTNVTRVNVTKTKVAGVNIQTTLDHLNLKDLGYMQRFSFLVGHQ